MTNEEIMAVVKPSICAKLKSPASAQFPQEVITVTGNDEIGYQVSGFVDSQNGYGAMIRNDFTATVSMVSGTPVVTASSVGTKAAANGAANFIVAFIAISILTAVGGALLSLVISMMVGM